MFLTNNIPSASGGRSFNVGASGIRMFRHILLCAIVWVQGILGSGRLGMRTLWGEGVWVPGRFEKSKKLKSILVYFMSQHMGLEAYVS